jgi:hypothetical protein
LLYFSKTPSYRGCNYKCSNDVVVTAKNKQLKVISGLGILNQFAI